MAHEPVGQSFEDGRLACAGVLDGAPGSVVHLEDILTVDDVVADAEGTGPGRDTRAGGGLGDRHRDGVGIVLAHEHHRKGPQRGKVEALVENALVDAAVAEEGHAHLPGALELGGEGHASRDGNRAADHGHRAQESVVDVGDVHGAALASRGPFGPAAQLGHQRLQRNAPGYGVAVAPVVADYLVTVLKDTDHSRGHRLLADRHVHGAADVALLVGAVGALLEPADQRHGLIELERDGGVRQQTVERRGHAASPLPARARLERNSVGGGLIHRPVVADHHEVIVEGGPCADVTQAAVAFH